MLCPKSYKMFSVSFDILMSCSNLANTLESFSGNAVIKQNFIINHLFTCLIIYLQVITLKTQLQYSCVDFSLLHVSHFIFWADRPSKFSYNLYFCITFAGAAVNFL